MNIAIQEELKNKINKLVAAGGNDYESLLREVDKFHQVRLNKAQAYAAGRNEKTLVLEWGRRTGKTTLRGHRWREVNRQMPRSSGVFVGPSYKDILSRIIPSIISGLEMFGIYKDLHYFIGRKPPQSWRSSWGVAYMPPENYDHYITFWTGVGIHLVSQDVKGDGRGLTTDFIDIDEMSKLSGDKIASDVFPTLSGTNVTALQSAPLFGSRLLTGTVALDQEGSWYQKLEDEALINPKKIAFLKATCLLNSENLLPDYLEEERRNAVSDVIFKAEYLNIRPEFVKDGFYTMLNSTIHCYTPTYNYNHYNEIGQKEDCRMDGDLVPGVPLILGVDWGASINCLTVNQYIKSMNEYRTLKSMYVLGDEQKIQEDLFKDFHDYYEYHFPKEITVWYDNTGNVKTGITRRTRAQLAQQQLANLGWKVSLMTIGGANPNHEMKYLLWVALLKGDHPYLPKYLINKVNCKELYISMKNAKAKTDEKTRGIKKDKSSERSKVIPRQEATDLSDANDTPVFGLFRHLIKMGSRSSGALPDLSS